MIIGDKKIIVVDNNNREFGDRLKEKEVVFQNYYERYYLVEPTGEEKVAKEFIIVQNFPYNIISANVEACYSTGLGEHTATPKDITCSIIREHGKIFVELGDDTPDYDKILVKIIYTN